MADFNDIELHRINPPVKFHKAEKTIEFGGETQTPEEWEVWSNRVNKMMLREGWVEPPRGRNIGVSQGTTFLYHNLDEVNKSRRGRIKKAPWFLRWKYDKVITKETLPSV